MTDLDKTIKGLENAIKSSNLSSVNKIVEKINAEGKIICKKHGESCNVGIDGNYLRFNDDCDIDFVNEYKIEFQDVFKENILDGFK